MRLVIPIGSPDPYREAWSQFRLLLKALRTRFWDQKPFILSHLLTGRCNANCQSCLWKLPAESRADELTTEQVMGLYAEAVACGFRELVLWGGEPLLRPDAPALLGFARNVGMRTTLITNGWSLADRHADVLPNVNRLILSLDAVGDLHDDIRGCSGLFRRINAALDVTLAHYGNTRVVLICVVSKLNFNALEPLVDFARERKLPLLFQHMNLEDYGAGDRSENARQIALSATESGEVSARLRKLRISGARLRDSTSYLEAMGRNSFEYRCHYKKVLLRVEANGDILDCTRIAVPLVNIKQCSLKAFLDAPGYRQFISRAESCNRCRDIGVVELSHIWEGHLRAVVNATLGAVGR